MGQLINQTHVLLEPTWPNQWALLAGGDLRFQVGDVLAFWDLQAGRFVSTRTITAIEPPNSQRLTPVWLDGPVGAVIPGPIGDQRMQEPGLGFNSTVTQVFNLNQTANQLVFRRNIYRNGRRTGLVAKGSRALVEDNVVEGTGGGGLELWPAPYSGLCASDYMVRGNLYNDTNQLDRVAAPLWADAFAAPGVLCHQRLWIHNNTFAAGPGSMFLLSDTADVRFTNNTIVRCGTDKEAVLNVTNVADIDFDTSSNRIVNLTSSWLCDK